MIGTGWGVHTSRPKTKRRMSRHDSPSPSPLGLLAYRCRYCGKVMKPEKQAGDFTLANIAVIEPDGLVRKACRRCADLPIKVPSRAGTTSRFVQTSKRPLPE
jgi:hypothetical protein